PEQEEAPVALGLLLRERAAPGERDQRLVAVPAERRRADERLPRPVASFAVAVMIRQARGGLEQPHLLVVIAGATRRLEERLELVLPGRRAQCSTPRGASVTAAMRSPRPRLSSAISP